MYLTWNLPLLSVQFHGTKFTHAVQISPSLIISDWNSVFIKHSLLIIPTSPPYPQPRPITILCPAPMDLTALGILRELAHTMVVFYDWLLSVSVMSSRFTHVVARVRASFLFEAE